MLKLYGNPYSRANRVRWALEASGTAYEEEQTALGQKGTDSERFRAINPNARIPVIDDSGLILFESIPICLYIAKKYAPGTLYVNTVEEEGVLLQWSVWAMTELEKYIETASLHVTWYEQDKRDPDIAASALAQISRCLSMVESAIKGSGFLVAGRFTIADLIVSEVLTSVAFAKVDLNDFPAVKNYLMINLSQAAAKNAFAADVISPYLT